MASEEQSMSAALSGDDSSGSPLTAAQKAEIDRRLAAHRANPDAAIPWEQVKAEALARFSKGVPPSTPDASR